MISLAISLPVHSNPLADKIIGVAFSSFTHVRARANGAHVHGAGRTPRQLASDEQVRPNNRNSHFAFSTQLFIYENITMLHSRRYVLSQARRPHSCLSDISRLNFKKPRANGGAPKYPFSP